jgi:hypothetical protein
MYFFFLEKSSFLLKRKMSSLIICLISALSKFKQLPPITQAISSNLENTETSNCDFNYPLSGSSNKINSKQFKREDYLRICETNFKIIKNWSHTRRVTLLSALLKYCNNDLLLYIREEIKKKSQVFLLL